MRTLTCVVGWCLLSLSAAADSSVQALLKHVPAKSQIVVVMPSVDRFVAGIQAFGKATGIEDMENVTAGELFQMQLGAAFEHMNTAAPIVFAGTFSDDQPVFICVMKEPGAIEKLEGSTKAEGGLISFEGGMGTSYAGMNGEVAVVGVTAEQTGAAFKADGKAGEAVAKALGKALEKNHVLVYLDPAESKSQIEAGLTDFESTAGAMTAGPQAAGGAAMVRWMADAIRYAVSESQAWVIAARMGESGAEVETSLQPKSEGKLASYLKGVKKSEIDQLSTMPDAKAAMVVSYNWTPPSGSESITEQFMRAVQKDFEQAEGEKKAEMEKMIKHACEFAKLTSGATFAMSLSPDKKLMGGGTYIGSDPKALMEAMDKFAAMYEVLTEAMTQGADVKLETNKEKIGSVDAMLMKMAVSSDDPMMQQAFDAMYGAGFVAIFGPSPAGIMYTMGQEASARELFNKLGDGKGSGLGGNADVKKAMSTISEKPAGFMLVDPVALTSFGVSIFSAMFMPLPELKLPEGKPTYVAGGMYLDTAAIRFELNVPAAAVKAVKEAIESLDEEGAQ